ncbi:neutral zinc metallopeptidase [Microbispora bryophytorum]|uniref:Neutral zinc metallopeptidase n=1 Tax=Microbispora bryophytorum subsp. camponoti TaxID=1677852 RepID=A0ABR8L4E2_9ACTN|nr:neutral zinc metallopeptidase [Microbispora camponoti]MBD3143334.1 neutral zinc metallopeptidase [Microbispora camponoti]
MDFRDDVDLDASQVEEGGGGFSGGGFPGGGFPGGGLAIGGGVVGVVALVVALVLGVNPADLLSGGGSSSGGSTGARPASDPTSRDLSECKKGSDADQSEKCRVVGVVNSVQKYWRDAFAERGGQSYRNARTVLFTNAVSTGCGQASSAVGPFYCPADSRVYLDLGFFKELESEFGAKGGPFAQAYVIGHEYGHHVQNILGTNRRAAGDSQGAGSASVRLELQADCYAGVWAKNAVDTGFYESPFTKADIQEALDAAAAVGDDRIQERSRGRVDPEGWTHGSSQQRVKWFTTGYTTGSPARCDTFSGTV